MANESIAFDVELKTAKAATGVQSLRTELKNLRNQLASLDEGSAEFSKIAAKAGAVQDKIGDLKDTIAAFHPERKFQAFTQGIQGVVGGFTAVQGAMALFGNESEDLQKTLVKVQGAMALSQGLNSIMGLGDAFKNMKLVAVSAFGSIRIAAIATFTTIKGAMISTGIGVLVVGLGLLIQKLYDMSQATNAANKSSKDRTEKLKEELEATLKLKNATADSIKALEIEKIALVNKISSQEASLIFAKEEVKLIEDKIKRMSAIAAFTLTQQLKLKKAEIEGLEEIAKKQKEVDKIKKDIHDSETKRQKIKRKEAVELKQEEKEESKLTLKGEKEFNEKIKGVLTQRNEDRKNALEWIAKAEVQIKSQTIDSLAGIGALAQQLAGESKELMAAGIIAENAAGIAKIIINAQAANAAAIAQGTALSIPSLGASTIAASALVLSNNISAGIAIASSIAATTKALSALGSGGSAGGGGGNTSAPPPMTRPQSSRVSLDSGGKPISVSDKSRQRVYVVERDITNAQNRVALIQARAKIG